MADNRKKYNPGKTATKVYLSEEARQLVEAESARTTYPMSVVIDMLIKKHLPAAVPTRARAEPPPVERQKPASVDFKVDL